MKFIFPSQTIAAEALVTYQPKSEFEKRAVDFALAWLQGNSEFQFQSSGSTGLPKSLNFTRSQIQGSVALTQQAFNLKAGEMALLCLDSNFVASKLMIARALILNMDLLVLEPTGNPIQYLNQSIDFAALVPYQLEQALNHTMASQKLSWIKQAIVGGAAIHQSLWDNLLNYDTIFYETYGMTETLTHVAIRKISNDKEPFRALPGITIVTDDRQCLRITAPHIQAEPIQTNDIAELASQNSFNLIGRFDDVINTGGIKVFPELIEQKILPVVAALISQPSLLIAGMPDTRLGQRLVLFIEGQQLSESEQSSVFHALRSILNRFEMPKQMIFLPKFERTSSGKINRKATVAQFLNNP